MSKKTVDTIERNDSLDNCNTLFTISYIYQRAAAVVALALFVYGLANDNFLWGLISGIGVLVSIFVVSPLIENKAYLLKNISDIHEHLRTTKKEKQ